MRLHRDEHVATPSTDADTVGRPRAPVAEPLKELNVENGTVRAADAAQVVLSRSSDAWQHRGAVSLRGPCAPTLEKWEQAGFHRLQAQAWSFAAVWFGSAVDAVTIGADGGLRWGFWRLSGKDLIWAFHHWLRQDPRSFEQQLGRYGLGVQAGGGKEPALILQAGERARKGSAAERLISSEPRLVAVLALAARSPEGQSMQLRAVARRRLGKLLQLPVGETTLGARATQLRDLAALGVLDLRLSPETLQRLIRQLPPEGECLPAWIRQLNKSGSSVQGALRWVQSSPELVCLSTTP